MTAAGGAPWQPCLGYRSRADGQRSICWLHSPTPPHLPTIAILLCCRACRRERVVRIERVQSMQLWTDYQRRLLRVSREAGGAANEQQLFHGTSQVGASTAPWACAYSARAVLCKGGRAPWTAPLDVHPPLGLEHQPCPPACVHRARSSPACWPLPPGFAGLPHLHRAPRL